MKLTGKIAIDAEASKGIGAVTARQAG